MKMKRFTGAITLALMLGLSLSLAAQEASKRPLSHADYDAWQSMRGRAITDDGRWAAYVVSPQVGDGELVIVSTDGKQKYSVPRGTSPQFTEDGNFVTFRINPPRAETKAYERSKLKKPKKGGKEESKDKAKKLEKPLPSLGIMNLSDGTIEKIERLSRHRVPSEGPSIVAYTVEPKKETAKKKGKGKAAKKKEGEAEEAKAKPTSKPAEKKESPGKKQPAKKQPAKKKEDKKKYHKEGKTLYLKDLESGSTTEIKDVESFGITRKKGILWYSVSTKKATDHQKHGFYVRALRSGQTKQLVVGAANYRSVTTNRDMTRMVFLSDHRDRDADKPTSDIWAWAPGHDKATMIVSHTSNDGFPQNRCVDSSGGLNFSYDGSSLMFGACLLPKEDMDPILSDEKVTMDLWHYKDPLLQPMQAKRAGSARKKAYSCVWNFAASKLCQVVKHADESARFLTPDGSFALVTDSAPYGQRISWDSRYSDVYVVNTLDGSRRVVMKEAGGRMGSSPTGRYLTYFKDLNWFCIDLMRGKISNLTEKIDVPFYNEDHDTPSAKRPHGIAGWTAKDGSVLIYDRYDIWRINPDGSNAVCVTEKFGRAQKTRLRYRSLDREQRWVPTDSAMLLSAMNEETMASGFYSDQIDEMSIPQKLVMKDMAFSRVQKPKKSDRYFFTLSTFRKSPDLWVSSPDFKDMTQLSHLNPQQSDFSWGNSELVTWHSADGKPLKGILIKPDGFDPKKKYPMMVYFYERMSSRLHNYVNPAPGTSPNAAYYVSNGYLWFMPDITYREGYPGESCLKCVVSGVQSLIAKGFVDRDSIGAAGHSWGGYQTAYLVTKTNIFKAVESGAPVVNMTSAYGGIRWGSGMSRAFQYEKTQSRIGGSLWEYPLRYLENSPLFSADKVETPVLMLHNDRDGAVPWYQGIEYFCALRRLGKEVYMMNYVGADHGLRRRANQMDWTKRMQQYFDYHLRGKTMPSWMAEGVPYIDRTSEKREFIVPETLRIKALEASVKKANEGATKEKAVSGSGDQK